MCNELFISYEGCILLIVTSLFTFHTIKKWESGLNYEIFTIQRHIGEISPHHFPLKTIKLGWDTKKWKLLGHLRIIARKTELVLSVYKHPSSLSLRISNIVKVVKAFNNLELGSEKSLIKENVQAESNEGKYQNKMRMTKYLNQLWPSPNPN